MFRHVDDYLISADGKAAIPEAATAQHSLCLALSPNSRAANG